METRRAGIETYSKTRQKESLLSPSKTQVCKANRLGTFQELTTEGKWQGWKRPPTSFGAGKGKNGVPAGDPVPARRWACILGHSCYRIPQGSGTPVWNFEGQLGSQEFYLHQIPL